MSLQHPRSALWLALPVLLAVGGHQLAQAAEPPAPAAAAAVVREEELLLFAVELDGLTLTDSLAAYGEILDPLLPLGYDVELYVNDILRSGQRTPVEGRYEFLQVPLVRGP